MTIGASFSSILNEYSPNQLFMEEAKDRMWAMSNIEHDQNWLGGSLVVTFEGSQASSVEFGAMAETTDVSEDVFVKGTVTTYAECFGTMKFLEKDIYQHGKLNSQNLVKLLPDRIDHFMDHFSDVASLNIINGKRICKITSVTDAASGIFVVDRIERLRIGQKVSLLDNNTASVNAFVKTINKDTGAVTLSATRGGAAANYGTDYTLAQVPRLEWAGAAASGCSSLRNSLLSSANGGSSSLYGTTKTAYPYLQAQNIDGSGVTTANLLDKIFDGLLKTRQRGRGKPETCLMSPTNFGVVLKLLEAGKGAFHQDPKSAKIGVYGWDEISIWNPVGGGLKLVCLHEMDDDVIHFLDTRPSVMKIYSNGGIRKRVAPDGKEYYEVRATTGFSYYVDINFQFEFVLQRPSYCGVMYDIPSLA